MKSDRRSSNPMTMEEERKNQEEDLALIRDLARRIVEKRLQAPAVFFLEASRPLSFMASQAMIFLGPLVQAVYPIKLYRRVAELLEDRDNVDRLIREIEEQGKK